MINTILFDFDGTMMNTRDGIISSWKYLFKKVTGKDVSEEFPKNTFGEPLKDSLKKFFPDIPVEESLEIYRGYQRNHHKTMMVPFDGIVETIKELKKRGYKIGLVTSRGENSATEGLKAAGIIDCFGALVTANSCDKHKPEPEPIWLALEKLEAQKEETVMIGDTMYDLKGAKNAGVKSVLVGWSEDIKNADKLGEYKPDFIISKAADILKIVGEK